MVNRCSSVENISAVAPSNSSPVMITSTVCPACPPAGKIASRTGTGFCPRRMPPLRRSKTSSVDAILPIDEKVCATSIAILAGGKSKKSSVIVNKLPAVQNEIAKFDKPSKVLTPNKIPNPEINLSQSLESATEPVDAQDIVEDNKKSAAYNMVSSPRPKSRPRYIPEPNFENKSESKVDKLRKLRSGN